MLQQVPLPMTKTRISGKKKVYTFGYGRHQSFLKVKQALREVIPHDQVIVLVDVRHWPYTRWGSPDWNKDNLKERIASEANPDLDYEWLGGHVGNPHKYNQANFITIMILEREAQLKTFKNWIYRWLREGKVPALFCACYANAERVCHRYPLADYLRKELRVEVVHL